MAFANPSQSSDEQQRTIFFYLFFGLSIVRLSLFFFDTSDSSVTALPYLPISFFFFPLHFNPSYKIK